MFYVYRFAYTEPIILVGITDQSVSHPLLI